MCHYIIEEDIRLFKTVILASRIDLKEAVYLSKKIFRFLKRRNITIILEKELASKIGEKGTPLTKAYGDFAIIIGGDGTVLRVANALGGRIPLYVIKVGRIGFFADTTPKNALVAIGKVLNQEFVRDESLMLSSNLHVPDVLNEIRIGTVIPRQMMELSIYINGSRIIKDRMDAVVIATPVGATAYALSAGANIIDPSVDAILIVPICPLSPNLRPVIVPSNAEVSIRSESQREYTVLVDGHVPKKIKRPLEVKIWKSEKKTVFLRADLNFYERLRRRLDVSFFNF